MSYIVLNGKKSTEITGLLIQTLPPIVKPRIRTEIEEIDGRDGDIVTKLGYSAYDKEFDVGLYGDYRIDDVIRYFDSSGTVIFSNEADKYYKYEIVDQIDFEHLLRFKTATVKMHVQPFKFSVVEKSYGVKCQLLNIPYYLEYKSGLALETVDDGIHISGESSVAVEAYLQVSAKLSAGAYTLATAVKGTGYEHCEMRLIETAPTDAETFGGHATSGNATLTQSLESETVYSYIYLYITAGTMDFTLSFGLTNDDKKSLHIINSGNRFSKPLYTLSGIGTVDLSINGTHALTVAFRGAEALNLDVAQMEAYYGDVLMNRIITGDYNDMALKVGTNVIEWTGILTNIELLNYSRWT